MHEAQKNLDKAALKAIGLTIRGRREARGWSQEHLAEIAGIHDRTVGKIERGELNFSVLLLVKLSRALDCSPNRILDL